MPCCKKYTAAQVSARRDAKRLVVETFTSMAEAMPACADGNGRDPNPGQRYNAIFDLWGQINATPGHRLALRTGKGCGTAPTGIPIESSFNGTTVADFIQWGAENLGDNVDCWGSYTRIAYLWSLHIIANNAQSFPTAQATALRARGTGAIAAHYTARNAQWAADGLI